MIDTIDYSILKCLAAADRPVWKKQLHRMLEEQRDRLPLPDHIALQTVGRHIDRMHSDSLLTSSIINPEELRRNLIIGYRPTQKGRRMLEMKRSALLKKVVADSLFNAEDAVQFEKDVLAEMINDEFGLDGHTDETVRNYSRDELTLLLGLYFLKQEAADIFDESDRERFRTIIQERQEVTDAIPS